MEVKEFVSATIIEIIEGICMAQEYARDHGAIVNSGERATMIAVSQEIAFDMLVTEQDSTEAKHGVAVVFAPLAGSVNSSRNKFSKRGM